MNISLLTPKRLILVLALALIVTLTACSSGGGGNTIRQSGSICTDPRADNTGAPTSCSYSYTPTVNTCADPKANNIGKPLPCTYHYTHLEKDNLLISNGATAAHVEGFTGKGITVGMVDEVLGRSFSPMNMDYLPLNGKVLSYDTALTDIKFTKAEYEQNPHFLFTGSYLAGRATAHFSGGIAPEAQLRWLGVCTKAIIDCTHRQQDWKDYLQTVLKQGDVRLINASLASGSGIHNGRYTAEWEPLLAYDALIVGSAGNEKKSQPAVEWQAPIVNVNEKFYGHFIVATAVHINTSTRSHHDSWDDGGDNVSTDPTYQLYRPDYANACGIAKEWCVSAASNILLPNVNNPNQLYRGAGTSGAAPIITGVAALVLEAYPWMSASNIQQTVLTTATDIGAPGVDPIYGWGLVNAAKAIHGPAEFVHNKFIDGFIADFNGGSRPFSNDIKGEGWLRKRGNGTLTLTGNNTYTGGTFVEAGTLRSSGSFASDINVAPGALFMTLYDAQKTNKAVTIKGNYHVHNAASWNMGKPVSEYKSGIATTAIQLGAPLEITGKATIASNSRLLLLRENQGYSVKSTETLITANQGLSGQFSEFSYGSDFFWDAKLHYNARTLSVDLTRRTSAQGLARSLNASAKVIEGAGMADKLIGHTDQLVASGQTAGHEALLSATAKLMSAPDNETATRSLSSLSGEIHSTARVLGIQRAFAGGEGLAERLHTLGSRQPTGVWLHNAANNGQFSRLGYGDSQVQHSTTGIGADALFGERWLLGISAAQATSNAHLDGLGGRLSGMGRQMAVYARTHLGHQGYFSGLISFDEHTVDTQRQVLLGDTVSHISGQHTDNITLFRLESGLNLKTGLAPYIATGTLSLQQSGFSESGMLGLSATADTFTTEFVEIGARFDHHLGGRWTWAANTSARRMFSSENGFNAAFVGAEDASFTVLGQSLTGTGVRLSSEIGYQTGNGWQFSLSLGTEHGNSQKRNTWSQANAKISF